MDKDKISYILVLPSWYPSRVDHYNGDFNQRLVKALSIHIKQIVLYVIKDPSIKKSQTEISIEENTITHFVYYPACKIPLISKLHSLWNYYYLNKKHSLRIISEHGIPSLIHCYVFFKAVWIAKWLKRRYHIPIILTEHWTAFYDYSKYGLHTYPLPIRLFMKMLIRSIDHIIPVSKSLKIQIKKWGAVTTPQTIIPNVVDIEVFNDNSNYQKNKNSKKRFIHISTMNFQKNGEGMLRTFESVLREYDIELWLLGTLPKHIEKIINDSSLLKSAVVYKGELSYGEVAKAIQQCDCLVMFSRCESFSCVIAETLCCGLPIIATDIVGIADYINTSNGILVPSENERELKKAIISMINNLEKYEKPKISETAIKAFNYESVSFQITEVYKNILAY